MNTKSVNRSLTTAAGAALLSFALSLALGSQPAEAQVCQNLVPHCVYCSGNPVVHCIQCEPGYEVYKGACVSCSFIDPKCRTCDGTQCTGCVAGYGPANQGKSCQSCSNIDPNCTHCSEGSCTGCKTGYGPAAGGKSCQQCDSIDPNCTSCNGGSCTACEPGYGPSADGQSCQACNTIDPNCTKCGGGVCKGCVSGYGPAAGGGSCQLCSTLDPNCTSCSGGKCDACTNGTAANLQGECLETGNSSCPYSVEGQCCKCQYSCQGFNPPSGTCVGSFSNGCGACSSRT